ncbi:hypothetical protein ASPZODRAFT_1416566 [Penicilliopsis zonata CBS 506.65]|uniref:Uncharacterized protein n=1 Tax=Penicilliopsis zonata CBS 506.65 TaxID=1073090 RepID=A0A1L9SQ52_9EURO|nr:hypothetical protein ASPZODRAFT_1416566 [Penicilliopsis zonata CBS 506.65]OJJ49194.1 hypothetical protein ASPZODRAFT_1416566 [Penicilliopsis zonata CBS 506.65]
MVDGWILTLLYPLSALGGIRDQNAAVGSLYSHRTIITIKPTIFPVETLNCILLPSQTRIHWFLGEGVSHPQTRRSVVRKTCLWSVAGSTEDTHPTASWTASMVEIQYYINSVHCIDETVLYQQLLLFDPFFSHSWRIISGASSSRKIYTTSNLHSQTYFFLPERPGEKNIQKRKHDLIH